MSCLMPYAWCIFTVSIHEWLSFMWKFVELVYIYQSKNGSYEKKSISIKWGVESLIIVLGFVFFLGVLLF